MRGEDKKNIADAEQAFAFAICGERRSRANQANGQRERNVLHDHSSSNTAEKNQGLNLAPSLLNVMS